MIQTKFFPGLNFISRRLTILVLLFSLFSFQDTSTLTGKVISIQDGDTITILTEDNQSIKIRLEGIDCPERNQDFGTRARQFTSDLAYFKHVKIVKSGIDRFGRTLGFVILPDGKNLNHELLRAGLAWHYKKYNQDPYLANLEEKAKENGLGLWSLPNPIPPWDFRRNR